MMNNLKAKRSVRRRVLLCVAAGCFVGAALISRPEHAFGFFDWVPALFGQSSGQEARETEGEVLSAHDEVPLVQDTLLFRIKTRFADLLQARQLQVSETLTVQGTASFEDDISASGITFDLGDGQVLASNIMYSLTAGDGLEISGTQDLTILNTGVLSVQGETGEVAFSAGDGIALTGTTITNNDRGSSQAIFRTIKVGGATFSASSNTDILEFAAGTGVTLATDTSGKKVTLSADSAALNVSGWRSETGRIFLKTAGDNVGIGTSNPQYKLQVVGATYLDGNTTVAGNLTVTGSTTVLSGFNNSGGGIVNAGAITGATGITSSGTITFSGLSTGVVQSSLGGVLSSGALNLGGGTSYVTGVLPVANGGTGLSSLNAGDILFSSGANTISALGLGGDGQVLTVSGGSIAWGSISGGGDDPCSTCLVNNPNSTQSIIPTSATATGLSVRQASGGTADIFTVASNDGSMKFFRVDSSGNVQLGDGNETISSVGTFTISPANSDPISISPVAQGSDAFAGTITSEDLTADRTWSFPDASGTICLATGNCSGTSASLGGSGTASYLSRFSGTYTITDSVLYDNGTNIGLGTTNPTSKLHVVGTVNLNGATTIGGALTASSSLGVTGNSTLGGTLMVAGGSSLQSTLEVTGATTLSSTMGVTGLATLGSNLRVDGTGNSYFMGNLGIGTSSPSQRLDLAGSVRLGAAGAHNVLGTSSSGGAPTGALYWGERTVCDSSGNCSGTSASIGGSGTANYLSKWSGTYGLTDSMLYDNGTNIGIGTTTPTSKLQVVGDGHFSGMLTLGDGSGSTTSVVSNLSGASDPSLLLSNGQVRVGGIAPVADTATAVAQLGETNLSGGSANGTYLGVNASNSFSGDFFNFQKNNLNVARLTNDGVLVFGQYTNCNNSACYGSGGFSTPTALSIIARGGSGDITIDANGGDIFFKSNTSNWVTFTNSSSDLHITPAGGDIQLVSSTLTVGTLGAGSTDSVITHSGGLLQQRTIDSRVWGSSLVDGSGSSNYVARWSDSDTLTTGVLFDNGTNVGIGTTSPNSMLHIYGTGSFGSGSSAKLIFGDYYPGEDEIVYISEYSDTDSDQLQLQGAAGIHLTVGWLAETTALYVSDAGNIGIGTTNPSHPVHAVLANGAYLDSGGAWTDGSSRTYKENFKAIDPGEILEKIASLDIKEWNYKTTASHIRHIGPFAEDFYSTFGVGNDSKHLASLDTAGVALVGIQGLNQRVEAQNQRLKILGASNESKVTSAEVQVLLDDLISQDQLTSSLSFSGSAVEFLKQAIFTARANFQRSVDFLATVTFRGAVKFSKENAGVATIPSGATQVRVSFTKQFEQVPVVYLTSQSALSGGSSVTEVTTQYFVISLTQAQSAAVKMQWLAVLAENTAPDRVEVLQQEAAAPVQQPAQPEQPTPAPLASPSPTPMPPPTSTPEPAPEEVTNSVTQPALVSPSPSPSPSAQPTPAPSASDAS